MGTFYNLKCNNCGYIFEAVYGVGFDGYLIASKQKELFEKGKGEAALQDIYDTLKKYADEPDEEGLMNEPLIELNSMVYECDNCKKFFIHDRISIECRKGIFIENEIPCPECGHNWAKPVEEEEIKPVNAESERCLSGCWCPRCGADLEIENYGLYD